MTGASIEFGCPSCGRVVEAAPGESVTCPKCSETLAVLASGETLERCLRCECDEVYRHRDFNQKLGIALLILGVGLWYWLGSFIPMVVAAGIDLFLFFSLPDVAICYRCKTHHRDFSNIKQLPKFDLERHEHYRFQKAKEEAS